MKAVATNGAGEERLQEIVWLWERRRVCNLTLATCYLLYLQDVLCTCMGCGTFYWRAEVLQGQRLPDSILVLVTWNQCLQRWRASGPTS